MSINWKSVSAPRTVGFLLKQSIQSLIDRKVSGKRRDQAVLEFVRQNAREGDPETVLAAMDDFAQNHRWLMNIGPEKGRIMIDALQDGESVRVLELGAYCGYSAVMIGNELSARNGHLDSIEISDKHVEIARQIVAHAGLSDCVTFHHGTLATKLESLTPPFDAVLLDHWKDEYLPDLKRLEKAGMIQAGAVVIADNVGFFAVPDYLDHVRESGKYRSQFCKASVEYNKGLEDGVEVSVYRG